MVLCTGKCYHNRRDIKLENMIYDPKTRVLKLIDFGTAVQFATKDFCPYKCVGTVISFSSRLLTSLLKSSEKTITSNAIYGL